MKKLLYIALTVAAVQLSASPAQAQQHRLWYNRPAATWTQALPVGNGTMGAMVFGLPAVERVQLNEETIWAGGPNQVLNPKARNALPKVRQLLFEGKYAEAQELANQEVMPVGAGQNMGMPFQPFGDLYVAMPGHAAYSRYERWLDIDNARSVVNELKKVGIAARIEVINREGNTLYRVVYSGQPKSRKEADELAARIKNRTRIDARVVQQ